MRNMWKEILAKTSDPTVNFFINKKTNKQANKNRTAVTFALSVKVCPDSGLTHVWTISEQFSSKSDAWRKNSVNTYGFKSDRSECTPHDAPGSDFRLALNEFSYFRCYVGVKLWLGDVLNWEHFGFELQDVKNVRLTGDFLLVVCEPAFYCYKEDCHQHKDRTERPVYHFAWQIFLWCTLISVHYQY